MWEKSASFILRKRILLMVITIVMTVVMGYFATKIQLTYDLPKIVPPSDPEYKAYVEFKSTFGDDGNVILLGLKSDKIYQKDFFNAYYLLSKELEKTDGVQNVISFPTLQILTRVDSIREMRLLPLTTDTATTQQEVDSLWDVIRSQLFYRDLAVKTDGSFVITGVTLKKDRLNDKGRIEVINAIDNLAQKFEKKHGVEFQISGLPYIRTVFSAKINKELKLFTLLSLVVCAAIMLLFFRSFSSLLYSLIIVAITLLWSLGYIGILQYKITAVIGVIPPLIVIIGITNCIYLLNKYHAEYRSHSNKTKALVRVVSRIGKAAFLTNFTTAVGFGVFYFSGSPIMKEFGLVAFLSIMSVFVISMVTVPIMFSFLPSPTYRQTRHLENKYLGSFIDGIYWQVQNRRKVIYGITIVIMVASVWGMFKLDALGHVIDDIPAKDKISTDLKFFEKEIKGVMPLEIVIDTKKPNGVKDTRTMQKMERLTRQLAKMPEFSRPVSIAELMKYANQAYNGGDSLYYRIPSALDLGSITSYIPNRKGSQNLLKGFVDSTYQKARISIQMADVGSDSLPGVRARVQAEIDSIFPKEEYTVNLTGTSMLFMKNNQFLVDSLFQSVTMALVVITLLLVSLFGTWRMIIISLIPNIIPLVVTSGVMGFFDIYLKPSTVIVFSIAFGISVDFTIHFVAKYRIELKKHHFRIRESVKATLHETGTSMIYTAIILFCGFSIFDFSTFGGTMWLGILTTLALVVSLLTNIFILPSMLLSIEKRRMQREMKVKPILPLAEEAEEEEND